MMSKVPNGELTAENMEVFMSFRPDHKLEEDIMLDEKLYFPPCIKLSTVETRPDGSREKNKSNIAQYLNGQSCQDNGYCVRANGSRRSAKYPHIITIRMICACFGRAYTHHGSAKYRSRGSFAAMNVDDTCLFRCTAYYDEQLGLAFVRKNSRRNFEHNGHAVSAQ